VQYGDNHADSSQDRSYIFLKVFYGRYLKKLSNQTQEAVGEMTKVASESLSALRTVQAYNAHEQETLKFHERIGAVLALAKKEATASAIFFGSTGWSGNVTLLSLLGYGMPVAPLSKAIHSLPLVPGGTLVSSGQISVGDLMSLLIYTLYVGNGLSMLTCVVPSSPCHSALIKSIQLVLRASPLHLIHAD
jgi:putative ABC transport system ATP-binding protein